MLTSSIEALVIPPEQSPPASAVRIGAQPPLRPRGHPTKLLSTAEMADALGIDAVGVQEQLAAGELFAVVFPQTGPEIAFPAFQSWPGIAGEPLKQLLDALGGPLQQGALAYGFFSAKSDILGDVTPVEMLLGKLTRARRLEAWAEQFLERDAATRLEHVLGAAAACKAEAEA